MVIKLARLSIMAGTSEQFLETAGQLVHASCTEPGVIGFERLARDAISKTGRIDILVNNAGATWGAPTTGHSLEAWDKLMSLNVRSVFHLSQQIGKLSMIPNGGGKILNIASIAGLRGNHPDPIATLAYNTSKAAVVNMTRAPQGRGPAPLQPSRQAHHGPDPRGGRRHRGYVAISRVAGLPHWAARTTAISPARGGATLVSPLHH